MGEILNYASWAYAEGKHYSFDAMCLSSTQKFAFCNQ